MAKDQAGQVAGSASGAGQHVAGVARDEAGNVATEAARQTKDLLGQARAELSQQAADQQQRVAGGLRSLGTELGSMAERSDEPGVASDLARQASSTAHDLAKWLEQRDPSSLLDEMQTFARRRPGTFLAIALGAGLAAGRLTRGLKDESSESDSAAPNRSLAPAAAATSTQSVSEHGEWGYVESSYPVTQGLPPADPYSGPLPGADVRGGGETTAHPEEERR